MKLDSLLLRIQVNFRHILQTEKRSRVDQPSWKASEPLASETISSSAGRDSVPRLVTTTDRKFDEYTRRRKRNMSANRSRFPRPSRTHRLSRTHTVLPKQEATPSGEEAEESFPPNIDQTYPTQRDTASTPGDHNVFTHCPKDSELQEVSDVEDHNVRDANNDQIFLRSPKVGE